MFVTDSHGWLMPDWNKYSKNDFNAAIYKFFLFVDLECLCRRYAAGWLDYSRSGGA